MAKAKGAFRDSHAPSWLSGPRTDVPTEHPSHRPWRTHYHRNKDDKFKRHNNNCAKRTIWDNYMS